MQFLYPIGLLALAGMLIPLLIHLWNIKQGKTLRIGSIALLGESSPLSSRSYKFTDLLLLLLRLLILLLITFLIAKPYLDRNDKKTTDKGWVLLKKQQLVPVYEKHRKTIDSLLKVGYSIHDFAPGFQQISLADTLNNINSNDTLSIGYLNLLHVLNQQKKAGFKTVIFADQKIGDFGEVMPSLDIDLKWIPLASADTVATWTADLTTGKYEAVSTPASTVYTKVPSAVKQVNIMINAGSYPRDAQYVRAAVQAYSRYSKSNIILSDYQPGRIETADVLIWFSETPVSEQMLSGMKKGGRVFSYMTGKAEAMNSTFHFADMGYGNTPIIHLNRRVVAASDKKLPVWTDGFGGTLLSKSDGKNVVVYSYYSRLNPDWSDLVWSSQFVRRLIPLLINNPEEQDENGFVRNAKDQRTFIPDFKISVPGVKHPVQAGAEEPVKNRVKQVSLENSIWTILLLLLCAERFLSFRKFKNLNNG